MNVIKESSTSLWMETADVRQARPLKSDEEADIVVVGSGLLTWMFGPIEPGCQ